MNIFVTGTDTDVGKTMISAWICKWIGKKAKYWKPIQTGNDSDTLTIKQLAPQTEVLKEAYLLQNPLSPYDASNLENVKIEIDKITERIPDKTVIEGAGGILVPICNNFQMIDLAKQLNSKVLVVSKSKLGFLNHIFMTVEILNKRNLDIIGIVINGDVESFSVNTIEKFSKLKVLGVFPNTDNIGKLLDEMQIPPEIEEILR